MTWTRWLRSRWVLGWALIKHVLYVPFAGRKGDPEVWLQRMGQENLGPTPPGNWQAAALSSRCIGCGLCDIVMLNHAAGSDTPQAAIGASMSQLIQGISRLPSDAPHVLEFVPRLLASAEAVRAICPTGVDPQAIAQLICRNAQVLRPLGPRTQQDVKNSPP